TPYAPDTLTVLEFIEFCYRTVAKPIEGNFHRYFDHYHLSFDVEAGKKEFRERINTIFARNGIAYQLVLRGSVVRLAPPVLLDALARNRWSTGDSTLDQMLHDARSKYLNPDASIRREGLERLWD